MRHDRCAPDVPTYSDHVTPPTSPEEARALLCAMIDAMDDVAVALCGVLAWWWYGPEAGREGD